MSNLDTATRPRVEDLTWSGEANPEKLSGEDVRGLLWLILAEADHSFGRRELFQTVRDKLDPKRYVRPGDQRVRNLMGQELLVGRADWLAFKDHVRLTPRGLRELEAAKPAYREKTTAAVVALASAATEWTPGRRPGINHTRIELDHTLESGLTVSWVNRRRGLMSLAGSDLMRGEQAQLPKRYQRYGDFSLVERRLELRYLEDGYATETLVFDYLTKDDSEACRRRYAGLEVPDMQTEIHRERVPLGVLRQLTAELAGAQP